MVNTSTWGEGGGVSWLHSKKKPAELLILKFEFHVFPYVTEYSFNFFQQFENVRIILIAGAIQKKTVCWI